MSAPGFWELVVLALLALVIFGPDRLPSMARNLGRTVAHFKREANATLEELKSAADVEDMKSVADEFRSTGQDLRRSASLEPSSTTRRPSVEPRRAVAASAADAPPPFDADAT